MADLGRNETRLNVRPADGTVVPLFSQNATVPGLSGFGSTGMTQTSATINNCVGSGCAPINTTTYYHGDQIGSSRLLTNGTGYPIWQGTFLPFGEEYNAQLTTNHYKFTAKERDGESGLDYFGARYYSNALGRWVSADWSATPVPVPYADFDDPQSLNQYSYVRSVPTTRTDPDGHCTVDGEKHNLGWCIGHLFGVNETRKERTARIEGERATLLDPKHSAHESGKPLTPAERYRIEHMTLDQVDSTYKAIRSQGIIAGTPPQIGAPGGQPPLRRIHTDETLDAGKSYEFWKGKSNEEIVESLKPGQEEALRTKPDGSVMNGNNRIRVLEERGVDVNSLPREIMK